MKEKILQALKEKFKGANASILNRIADKYSKSITTDEEVKTLVAGLTQDIIDVMDSYADSRATEATQTAIQNYEAKHKLKDGKSIADTDKGKDNDNNNEKGGGDDIPSWAAQIIEGNKALTERLNKMDSERTTTSRKQQLAKVYGKLPENLQKPYKRMDVEKINEEEFAALIDEVTTEVGEISSALSSKGAVFGRPAAHNGGNANKGELTKEQTEAINKREGIAADGEQPF